MTTTPYDSLPSGNNDITPVTAPKYVDVELAPPPAPVVEAKFPKQNIVSAPVPEKRPAAARPIQPQPPAKTTPISPPPQYSALHIKNLAGRHEYILPFEESLLVPDTMPDMQKILFAEGSVTPAQPGKLNYDRNDFLAGDITAYTIYRPVPSAPSPSAGPAAYNDCPVDVVKSTISFKTDKCWDDAEGNNFKPVVTIRSISAEMINERKFIVRGELLIKMTCICDLSLKVFKGISDENLMTLNDCVKATSIDQEMTDSIEISQEITLKEEQPAPVKILKEAVRVVENHKQITSGKLVVNGSIHLEALYLGEYDNGEKKLCRLTNKTDFTQFVVMDDNSDIDLICINFCSDALSLTIENKDKFMLSGKITSIIGSYRHNTIDTVRDAYHKQKDLHFEIIHNDINYIDHTVSGEISAREVVDTDTSDKKASAFLCGSCRLTSINGRIEKGRILIEGSMPVKILVLDEENTPLIIDHDMPIRGALQIPDRSYTPACTQPTVFIDAAVKEFWFNEINSRQVEINTVITMTARIFEKETFCTIDDLRFTEIDTPQRRTPMALYVVSSDDTLWDVAKKYKTDPETLSALNEIDPAKPLPAGAKLFISK